MIRMHPIECRGGAGQRTASFVQAFNLASQTHESARRLANVLSDRFRKSYRREWNMCF